jgi:hypothetical protein
MGIRSMKLVLEAITGSAKKWVIVEKATGAICGIVWRNSRQHKRYLVRGKNMHTLFDGGTPELRFEKLSEIREFIQANPEKYWTRKKKIPQNSALNNICRRKLRLISC